ncbi:MAG: hypothetical protein FWJ65_06755 [Limnochordales bacterium]
MTEVTVNDVRYGVMSALSAQFPGIKIYGEPITQGFEEPCFFVKLLEASHEKAVGRRYVRTHSIDVHYFDATNAALHDMAEQLYDCLETIQVAGTLCRGRSMSHEIVDGVLHFFVQYDLHVMRERPTAPLMRELEQEGYLK